MKKELLRLWKQYLYNYFNDPNLDVKAKPTFLGFMAWLEQTEDKL